MGYAFEEDESIPDGARRIAGELIDDAISHLEGTSDRDEAVHETRKDLKKLRALLRLLRGELSETRSRENERFRDAGRCLSELRDADALLESLGDLTEAVEGDPSRPKAALAAASDALGRRRERVVEASNVEGRVNDVIAELRASRSALADWPLERTSFEAFEKGARRELARGREAFREATTEGADEAWHEWRKRVKDHWYFVRLLEASWPALMGAWREELKKLSDLLGDDHDLVVLRPALAVLPDLGDRERLVLLELVDRRQADLRVRARCLGLRVHAPTPTGVVRRWGRWWQAWRG